MSEAVRSSELSPRRLLPADLCKRISTETGLDCIVIVRDPQTSEFWGATYGFSAPEWSAFMPRLAGHIAEGITRQLERDMADQ